METPTPTIFLKARSVALCCLVFIDLLWVISLCLVVFTRWEVLDHPQKSLLILMLVANAVSAIVLLILLLLEFRPWLDAARVALLLVVHIGTASAFVYWRPNFKCFTQTLDQEGLCTLIIIYLLIASWFIPGLLMIYATGLAVMVWKRSRCTSILPQTALSETMTQFQPPHTMALTDVIAQGHPSRPTFPVQLSEPFTSGSSLTSGGTESSQIPISKRLSKPSPVIYF